MTDTYHADISMSSLIEEARQGKLWLDGWAGTVGYPVVVIGTTSKMYRIRNEGEKSIPLAGRRRSLEPGATALVPKHAITIDRPKEAA